MPTTVELIPIEQLVNDTDTYVCSRNLFSFVNRNLNERGLQALVINIGDEITFMVNKVRRD
jgi:hypothetical protein